MVGSSLSVVTAALLTVLLVQRPAPAELAARMSGTWTLNLELSPSVRPAGRGRALGAPPSFAVAAPAVQRGAGRAGGDQSAPSDLTPAEMAARSALLELRQVSPTITITATAESIAFADARGERAFKIDGKKTSISVSGAPVEVRSRWDGTALRQEFDVPSSRLIRTWQVDAADRLTLTAKIESLTLRSADAKAVYDRQK